MTHVLIVDDDTALLEALPEALRLRMPQVCIDTADSGPVALRKVADNDYDAVVCDIKMPGMDGLAVLQELRRIRPKTPTLMITGHGQHDLTVQALRGGAYDFIQKPIDRDYFTASLGRAIEMRCLSRKLDQQQQSLQRHAEQLQQAVAEQTRELDEANRAKDQFLATLAHELRNPLAAIRHATEVLKLNAPAADSNACDILQRQVNHMAKLLDDLLDISRIRHGKIHLDRRPVELAGAVSDAVETSRPALVKRRHELTVRLPAEPVWLQADPIRLEQILGNLLNNAAKYSEPRGQILLSGEREGDEVVIRISDTGIGIPPEMCSRIFDLFAQADQSLDRAQGGLGIGLTLVRHLVQLHGGQVSARSEGPGRGSEFIVRLPALGEPAARRAEPPPQSGPPAGSRHVLVVEDSCDSRTMLAELLKLWGHRPELAADGLQAVEAVRRRKPEIALVDIGLPGLDGYEVARRIRSEFGTGSIYLVALTGYGQPEDRQRSHDAGFNAHLVKPVVPADLRRLLHEVP